MAPGLAPRPARARGEGVAGDWGVMGGMVLCGVVVGVEDVGCDVLASMWEAGTGGGAEEEVAVGGHGKVCCPPSCAVRVCAL